jgi:hypothetical protein
MPKFELRRLARYDDESLLREIQRVAGLIENHVITRSEFDRLAKASSSVICKRFGTWEDALARAGLSGRYSGTEISQQMLAKARRIFSDEELIAMMKAAASTIGSSPLTIKKFNQFVPDVNAETIRRRFGSWWKALDRAGLQISNLGKRYSEADYFENLLATWTHYGRQPSYGEMNSVPSQISAGAYEARWGTWRKALLAFLERVNADLTDQPPSMLQAPARRGNRPVHARRPSGRRGASSPPSHEPRTIRLGLRYEVLKRDRFRCVACGVSPSAHLDCELHVDHIVPLSRGGTTEMNNLRALCSKCNVGKGARLG